MTPPARDDALAPLPGDCLAQLVAIVGQENVILDPRALALASSDLIDWPWQRPASAVVKPRSTEETARLARVAARHGLPLIARGAGLSYSGGGVPGGAAIIVDTANLATIDIHADDRHARVGAGTPWEALARALAPHGLKPAQPMPISGVHTTVGGAASQGMPGGMDGIIGLAVVLADGTIARTGSGARRQGSAFQRYWGPDLTGMFLGDCGAYGVKTEICLRLVPVRPLRFASFSCPDGATSVDIMTRLLQAGLAMRVVANGPGNGPGAEAAWALHVTVEGATEDAADSVLAAVRADCGRQATEIDADVPRRLHARPFSIRGFVGLEGERWLPVHGVLPPTRAPSCLAALRRLLADRAAEFDAHGIRYTWTLSSTGPYVTIEPMFYWNDALTPLHLYYLSDRHRERFAGRHDAVQARALVRQARDAIRLAMDAHDAVHAQIGRYFAYRSVLEDGAGQLAARIKHALDPDGRMHPGALEA
ncbi:MAG: FAD-binding oxidoreductase [Alcaligenaceae bacterium]|nr:FAD-binding oxidoreductase [Alcaligenaceae bacterium SAGV5]MPS52370.1 FAD-binding oxidoreductase [Alcaligenaceae bacterium SAGV3]MPT58159.1 FAD-binding oxidoreductase [Alcaligenaceae bacterium]